MWIKTEKGWKLLGGPLSATPEPSTDWYTSTLSGLRLRHNCTTWKEWDARMDRIQQETTP